MQTNVNGINLFDKQIIRGSLELIFNPTTLCIICLLAAFQGNAQELKDIFKPVDAKSLRYENAIYEPSIRTVRFLPFNGVTNFELSPAIVPLIPNRPLPLRLSFDCLKQDPEYYEVQLIHCNADWTPSNMSPIDYMQDYNEFQIVDFEYSINTRVPYIHYWFDLPSVKMSGNYLIKVYREDDEDDLIITRRLMVYQELVGVSFALEPLSVDRDQHRLSLQVMYGDLDLTRPKSQMKVVIRQNYRWDNALMNIKPTFINQLAKTLDYRKASGEVSFLAGHEFRGVDLSDFENGGYQMQYVEQTDDLNRARVITDKPRQGRSYDKGLFSDRQGQYQVAVQQWNDPRIEADYTEVLFQLETGNPISDSIYVMGQFCDWEIRPELRMKYSASSGTYYAVALLKQGIYDYIYWHQGANPYKIEGSHDQTRNDYDVLVYYRPFGARGDLLVGYSSIVSQ